MKKIDLETIYSQADKDREDARLREIGEQQRNEANARHANGKDLIDKFVSPRRMERLDRPQFEAQVFNSH